MLAAVILTMLLVFARISGPAMQMSQTLQEFVSMLPAYAEFVELGRELAVHNVVAAPAKGAIAPGEVVFRDVSFHYDRAGATDAGIRHLNLTIAPGTIVGVSGPTGAGKTTFADLLLGLLELASARKRSAASHCAAASNWREHVSYVVQDPYLFRNIIRRNLLWAHPQATEADLWHALGMAAVDDFVTSLPAGLDTVLGERGMLVSGGERQRLCLARAALRGPWLFVLDEATSAIDMAAERKIIKRMLDLSPRPTILMIAHREESLARCDRMLRFQNCRVIADEPALSA
jgi:ATP-binding cassette subfamily C protein